MVKQLITYFTIYSLALFYGLIVSIQIVWRLIRNFGVVRGARRRDTPPSCLLDPDLGEHHFLRTASNVKFHYVAKGDMAKPLVLCLHGFPEFWYSWRYQLKAFSDQFRVVAVDLRGYGESDHPQECNQYKLSYLVNDIKEIVTALGYKSCILFCHDWGGVLGWYVAHLYPDLVDKLIACNIPHPRCFVRTIMTSRKQFLMSWHLYSKMCKVQYFLLAVDLTKYIFLFHLPYLPEFLIQMNDFKRMEGIFKKVKNCTDEDVEAYKYAFSQSGVTGPINYYRNLMFPDLPRGLCSTKIKAPTLVVWGTEDMALHKDTLKGTDEYVKDLTIKFVEGASHWVQMDEPEKVNQYIRDFLMVHTDGSLQNPD